MRKLLAYSAFVLGSGFSCTSMSNELPTNISTDPGHRVELRDVGCASIDKITENLKKYEMIPILMTMADGYETIVWKNEEDNSIIYIRYVDEETACIMGLGVNVNISSVSKRSPI